MWALLHDNIWQTFSVVGSNREYLLNLLSSIWCLSLTILLSHTYIQQFQYNKKLQYYSNTAMPTNYFSHYLYIKSFILLHILFLYNYLVLCLKKKTLISHKI